MPDTDLTTTVPCRREDLRHWIRLAATPRVGRVTARRLLGAFGLPRQVFEAGFEALVRQVPAPLARMLSAPASAAIAAQVDATLDWVECDGHHLLTLGDPGYPSALLNIPDPPLMLYAKGRLELLVRPSLAMVGSRNASEQGKANAQAFGAALSHEGWTIVSGLALGIDAYAHRGGLQGPGATVAVVGTGIDRIYPARNEPLARRIAEGGCIVSEYSLGTPAMAANFPSRNRIISGLARAVLVVEAAAKSGSLITARMALEQGRDVLAIPGSIHAALSKGCHALIKEGAALVESVADVLAELGVRSPASVNASVTAPPNALLDAIGHDPVHVDTLAVRLGCGPGWLSSQLLTLELSGSIECLPGGQVQRVSSSI